MAEDGSGGHGGQGGGSGGHGNASAAAAHHGGEPGVPHLPNGEHGRGGKGTDNIVTTNIEKNEDENPMSPRVGTPNPFSRKNTSVDLDDYFVRTPSLVGHDLSRSY